jgi:hypothetical protein
VKEVLVQRLAELPATATAKGQAALGYGVKDTTQAQAVEPVTLDPKKATVKGTLRFEENEGGAPSAREDDAYYLELTVPVRIGKTVTRRIEVRSDIEEGALQQDVGKQLELSGAIEMTTFGGFDFAPETTVVWMQIPREQLSKAVGRQLPEPHRAFW